MRLMEMCGPVILPPSQKCFVYGKSICVRLKIVVNAQLWNTRLSEIWITCKTLHKSSLFEQKENGSICSSETISGVWLLKLDTCLAMVVLLLIIMELWLFLVNKLMQATNARESTCLGPDHFELKTVFEHFKLAAVLPDGEIF